MPLTPRADPSSPPQSTAGPVAAVIVAVPARNEAARLARCLHSVDVAVREWGGHAVVLVGADACTDGTVAVVHDLIADGMPVEVVEGSWRRPSRVRAALVGVGRARVGDVAGEQVWLASTDADCAVPRRWIIDQVELADAGADVVLGDVSLDPDDTPAGLAGAFASHYADAATRRRHVHAANLGIRLSAYDRAGGWRLSTAIGEEHHLVRTAAGRGAAVRWGADLTVVTSGRVESRVAGGFASVLRRLQPAEDLATARPLRRRVPPVHGRT